MTAPQELVTSSSPAVVVLGTLIVAAIGMVGILLAGGDAVLVGMWLGACGLGVGQGVTLLRAHVAAQLQQTTTAKVDELQAAVGPANGENLSQLVKHVADLLEGQTALDTYTHDRNHDILGELHKLTASMPLLVSLAEKLNAQLPPPPERGPAPAAPT